MHQAAPCLTYVLLLYVNGT